MMSSSRPETKHEQITGVQNEQGVATTSSEALTQTQSDPPSISPPVTNSKTPPSQGQQLNLVKVVSVVDGDTIKVSIDGTTKTIRLIGIDTPETVDPRKPVQCFGREASDKAKTTLADKAVRLEIDSSQGDLDKYQRLAPLRLFRRWHIFQ